MDRHAVAKWVDTYQRAWRTAGTDTLSDLFVPDAQYLVSPWATPVTGLEALAGFWEAGRDGPNEPFTMTSEVVAVDGDTAVVRVSVTRHSSRISSTRHE
ncbi:SnoaL-like domain-containing protein [Nocardia uniformis]|uniref:SnoaL-like domain-containing protein n=1 Tax=Nocardia uniformis TaxID=53432 RepID=A0A849BQA7_9NOCA|nr:nuclear transport factor 2 family protein [Nocardia uniformis]NNH68773.1 SnoaL-like domain-containing protein [Nocardia uniformis]